MFASLIRLSDNSILLYSYKNCRVVINFECQRESFLVHKKETIPNAFLSYSVCYDILKGARETRNLHVTPSILTHNEKKVT